MAHPNSLKRLASGGVDPEAERYWTEYYGDYGEQLVRDADGRVSGWVEASYLGELWVLAPPHAGSTQRSAFMLDRM